MPYRDVCCLIVKSMNACCCCLMNFWKASFTDSICWAEDSAKFLHVSSSSSRRALNLSRSNLPGMQLSYALSADLRTLFSGEMSCCCASFAWKASKSFLSFSASARISCLKALHSSYWAAAMTLSSPLSSVSSYVMNRLCCSLMVVTCLDMTDASCGCACCIEMIFKIIREARQFN